MLLLHLMSIEETEEAIDLLKNKLQESIEKYGQFDYRTIELNKQLTLYINHYQKLRKQNYNVPFQDQ